MLARGSSIDNNNDKLVVGAPASGIVYPYVWRSSVGWSQDPSVGTDIVSPENNGAATRFGQAVTLVDAGPYTWAIICAPNDDSLFANAGRCFSFWLKQITTSQPFIWEWQYAVFPFNVFVGNVAGDEFGTVIAGADNDFVAIGCPNCDLGDGYARILAYNEDWTPDNGEDAWSTQFTMYGGNNALEACGSAVAASGNGWYAMGCPRFGSNNNGRVVVRSVDSSTPITDLVGDDFDQLGGEGTIGLTGDCASLDAYDRCYLTVSAANQVKKFKYEAAEWVLVTNSVGGSRVAVNQYTSGSEGLTTVISNSGQVSVFNVLFAPTASPTASPVEASTGAPVTAAPPLIPTAAPTMLPTMSPTSAANKLSVAFVGLLPALLLFGIKHL
jgi:hypothetical protein